MVVELTKNNLESVIGQKEKPVVIDFSAVWCGPCQMMKPLFESLAAEYSDRVIFAEVNVDEAREVAIQYSVSSVPTFLFIKNGEIRRKEVGRLPESIIREMIEDLF